MILFLLFQLVEPAPLQMQLLQNMPAYPMTPLPDLQQILDLQRLQRNPFSMIQPQPLVILLPNDDLKMNQLEQNIKTKDIEKIDEDLDSVVIDAPEEIPKRALVLLPNARFSLGDFISTIPWLPIEINVPDTISWAYNGIANGISGIISVIGQRFQRPTVSPEPASLKSVLNTLHLRNNIAKPVMLMPFETQRLNLPIQV